MKQFLLFALLATAFLAVSCDKGKFETVPTVVIKSFGPDEVQKGQVFTLQAEVTDKEGDLQDSILVIQKRFTGNIQVPPTSRDSTYVPLKELGFPNTSTVELRINFLYGEQNAGFFEIRQEQVDRGCVIGLIVQDKKKNRSAYVETKRITLKKV